MAANYQSSASMTAIERIIYYAIYAFVYVLSLFPLRVLYILSDFCYLIIYYLVGYRKNVVRKNLSNSFPEKTSDELLEIECNFYHFFCDYIFETIKLATISRKEMKRRMRFEGMEHIEHALNNGHNITLYLAHYCNWEWVTSIGLHLPPVDFPGQIYHVLENKVMDKLMLKLRSRMGARNISRFESLRKIAEMKRQKKSMVIGFISDQGPEMHTIRYWTTFLNQETAIITGTETISKKYDFACVYLDIQRPKRGYYVVTVKPLTEKSDEFQDFEITEMYARAFEENIKRQPQFWLWSHNRWKRTREDYNKFLETHKNNR